jgi:chromosome segregation ATPase
VESAVSASVDAYTGKLRQMQEELDAATHHGSELAQKLMAAEKAYHAEKLEMQKAYVKELDSSVESAVTSSVEAYVQKLRRTEEELSAAKSNGNELAQKLLAAEKAYHAEKFEMQKAYVKELDDSVESAVSSSVQAYAEKLGQTQEDLTKARKEVSELSEKLLATEKAYHDEKLEMQKAQVKEVDFSVESAVNAAVELLEQRLRHAHEEISKMKKERAEELGVIEESFSAEKARLLEDMDRRDRYIESADRKLVELEAEMMKYRQEASTELIRNISEQDAHFREAAAQEKARADERVKQLEELLAAKEQLLADSDRFIRQKQLDLDKVHAELNQRVNKFNEELFSQKQGLNDREKELNEYRLKLEKEYSEKAAALEPMKAELSRAILEYKGRK